MVLVEKCMVNLSHSIKQNSANPRKPSQIFPKTMETKLSIMNQYYIEYVYTKACRPTL